MPNQLKQEKIEKLQEKTKKAKAMYFADYRGLSVKDMQALKEKLYETDSEFQVTKNTLLKIALKNSGIDLKEEFDGPTATLFAYGDEVAPLKIVLEFSKENEQEMPHIKTGIFEGNLLTSVELAKLATVPSREVLLTQLVYTLQSPLRKLLYSLSYHNTSLVMVLNQIKKQKEENNN